ncbi:hemerythrin domain-containing protein [Actinomadura kijaniata]|uniref:hemerythrin domain-containing protein n=1 Tax=Actinomadura kijaniata TaxID=46161 RepID=UPI000829F229|nr:hemerythrin domain-containing protein [Actinomadura kijaniata]
MAGTTETVVDLLKRQHEEIRSLFAKVEDSSGKTRREAFDRLRHLLAVHETAEEEIVHPFAKREIARGDAVVGARLKEENKAKGMLEELERLGPDAPEFGPLFSRFHKDVEEHARHEEHEEFPEIERKGTEQQLRGMRAAVEMAERLAPTHPHQGVETPVKNLMVGPFAAVMDRTRDAIRNAMK